MSRHARRPRVHIDDVPLHIVQRGHNREPCFFAEEDYHTYLHWLNEALRKEQCALHAYALMTNHVHLLLTPRDTKAVPQLIIALGRRYVQYINVSYRRNALGQSSAILTPHSLYQSLGATGEERQSAHRALFRAQLNAEAISDIGLALNQSQPLGNERFYQHIEQMTGQRRESKPRGRPRAENESGGDMAGQGELQNQWGQTRLIGEYGQKGPGSN